ncbi:sigma-70 family RNA polymerase sigma factor [Muricauda sp. JGD-17]|uniref:Sigma-70 family RNA polymerase sigma factor n=1 Tax=Flagellimonas ochracea TaxID=2696472 RepID=A0A964WYM8_9FLAO|nr:sigma-70 family RNA polymerase sigma factor [Allomuricauda ochracea]NAY93386.1 sigma-70 family RNA polymerase sigma factor [Allomuricauda ochracea]
MTHLERYQKEYLSFQEELKSFVYRVITHKQETEDIVQETYIKAFKKIDTFKGKSSFKTWVFAIAINLAKDSLRARQRWGEDWMELVKDAHVQDERLLKKKYEVSQNSEHGKFVIREHISYCFNCVTKTLLLPNQICLLLKEIYSFKVSEIMVITGFREGKVKHAIADARKDMTRIFEKRCALINKKGICHQCTGLNKIYNPEQDTYIEANKLKMVKEAANKNYEELLNLRLQLAKSINPLNSEGTDLHNYLIENSPAWAKMQKAKVDS